MEARGPAPHAAGKLARGEDERARPAAAGRALVLADRRAG